MVAQDERLYQDLVSSLKNQLDFGKSEIVGRILTASIAAVDPFYSVCQAVDLRGRSLFIAGNQYPLEDYDQIRVVCIGKAAFGMAQAINSILKTSITSGIIIQKQSPITKQDIIPEFFEVYQGNHPIPGKGSVIAGERIIAFLQHCTADDLVLFLISGGGSALVTLPANNISLVDLRELTHLLIECGASIDEINTVRKHLDQIKGGGLARVAFPAKIATLILSDVIGNPLDMIASGPTVPDQSTFQEAKDILEKYQIWKSIPASIIQTIQLGIQGVLPETGKNGDHIFKRTQDLIIGDLTLATRAGIVMAKKLGFNSQIISNNLQGEAFQVGKYMASVLRKTGIIERSLARPVCLIAGGETTVTVKGSGLGGRNLEVALGAVKELSDLEEVAFISLATDGEDGPTDAAGALVTGKTYHQAHNKRMQLMDYLEDNDSYYYFDSLNALIKIGATGTNVNDLIFMFAF